MASSRWSRDISSRATSQVCRARHWCCRQQQQKELQMLSPKFRVVAASLLLFGLRAFAHDTPTGMHISTKSPQAHALFEAGVQKMEMLHIEDGLTNLRNAVKADPQLALGH